MPTEEEVKENKVTLRQWSEEHPKTVFWTRFVAWTAFSLLLPLAFLIWRFDLFQTIARIKVGGWGIIVIFIAAMFVFTVIRYVRLAMSAKYTLIGQCLSGFVKIVLPLLIALACLYVVRNNIDLMLQVLGCITVCEAIAVPLNPLPKWAYEMQKEVRVEERKDTVDYLLDGFFKRQENKDK